MGSLLPASDFERAVQRATYYDTAAFALRDNGFRCGSGTRKANGSRRSSPTRAAAPDCSRARRERPVAGDVPELHDEPELRAIVGGDELVPYSRSATSADAGSSRSKGRRSRSHSIRVRGRRGSILSDLECELELKAGDAAGLFALGRRIAAVAPVRLAAISKAERGYRLLGALPGCYKAEPIALDSATPVGDGLRANRRFLPAPVPVEYRPAGHQSLAARQGRRAGASSGAGRATTATSCDQDLQAVAGGRRPDRRDRPGIARTGRSARRGARPRRDAGAQRAWAAAASAAARPDRRLPTGLDRTRSGNDARPDAGSGRVDRTRSVVGDAGTSAIAGDAVRGVGGRCTDSTSGARSARPGAG